MDDCARCGGTRKVGILDREIDCPRCVPGPGHRERIEGLPEPAGLFPKYQVFKAATGEPVHDCIVLRPDRDRHAWDVLGYYAEAIEDEMPEFSVDLEAWLIGLGRPADPTEDPHHDSGSGGY